MSPIVEYCNGIFRHTVHRKRNILGWKMNTTMIVTHTQILLMSNMSFIEHGFMNRLALFTVYTAHVTSIPKASMNKLFKAEQSVHLKGHEKLWKLVDMDLRLMQYSLPVIYFSSTNIYQCCDCYWKHMISNNYICSPCIPDPCPAFPLEPRHHDNKISSDIYFSSARPQPGGPGCLRDEKMVKTIHGEPYCLDANPFACRV